MYVLLDTHVLIWWWAEDKLLPAAIRDLMASPDTTVFVSAVSALEIAIKVRLGRLPSMEAHIDQFNEGVVGDGFVHLNVHYEHAWTAGLLPGAHRDPFDRTLAAQSICEAMPIITGDPAFASFGCKVIW
jgi:PIN domain nuclease of toxin-antitoxin system